MKRSHPPEPRRWKDLPAGATGVEAEIGAATRLVRGMPAPDEVRLAQRAARAAQDLPTQSRPPDGVPAWSVAWTALRARRRARTMALVLSSLLVGGVATAVSGRIIQRFQNSRRAPTVDDATPPGKNELRRRSGKGSGRVNVDVPTEGDLSVGPAGTSMPVGAGRAATPTPDLPGAGDLEGAASGRAPGGAPARAPGKHLALRLERVGQTPDRRPSGPPPPPQPPQGDMGAAPTPTQPPPLLPPDTRPEPVGLSVLPSLKLNRAPPSSPPKLNEAALVARALGRLRRDHDPLWALNDLDEHHRRFPAGTLRREAALARAEALLTLKRDSAALAVLDTVKLEPTDIDRRTYLARAELRAQDGRRAEAIADFDRVLVGDRDDDLAARALYGRAVCRVRGGDLGGARVDFQSYVRRFPEGAHRADVEKMLRRLGG